MEKAGSIRNQRRPKGHISSIATNLIHRRNPYITASWSAAIPGFGQIATGSYIKGFLLVIWEIVINLQANINIAILYSFTGRFELAKQVLDKRWMLLYVPVYIYAIWDSYRSTVELNKYSIIADWEKSPIKPFKISTVEINYLDKRSPWLSATLSAFMPGSGHLYGHRLLTGFFILVWFIIITYCSHFLEAIHFSLTGAFGQATAIADPHWLLFLPSLYGFTIYDSYASTVEDNKLFEIEQSRFLKEIYQDGRFRMPVK